MYTRELLLVAGILLLVFLGRREHLAFTDTVKDVRQTIDQAEQDRIFAMAPESLRQKAIALNAAEGHSTDRSKTFVAWFIRDFQSKVYVSATAPITETLVDNYVSQQREARMFPSPLTTFIKEALSNGDAKRLLMSYLNLTPAGTIPPLSSVPESSSTTDINTLLTRMRDNLLEYKMTGKSEYKQVYEGTKAWMDNYIANLNTYLAKESDSISSEVTSYRNANAEMAQIQSDFQDVSKKGPELENSYLTIKQQMDEVPRPDSTSLYVKGGIAAGLALGIVALSFF
jgi:hypothetical protein